MLPNALYLRPMTNILITTTPTVQNRPVREYLGIVSGEAFAHGLSLLSSDRLFDTEELDSVLADTPWGIYWSGYKAKLHKARDWAIQQMAEAAEELGANAVIGVSISMYDHGRYRILIATGTAVRL